MHGLVKVKNSRVETLLHVLYCGRLLHPPTRMQLAFSRKLTVPPIGFVYAGRVYIAEVLTWHCAYRDASHFD